MRARIDFMLTIQSIPLSFFLSFFFFLHVIFPAKQITRREESLSNLFCPNGIIRFQIKKIKSEFYYINTSNFKRS